MPLFPIPPLPSTTTHCSLISSCQIGQRDTSPARQSMREEFWDQKSLWISFLCLERRGKWELLASLQSSSSNRKQTFLNSHYCGSWPSAPSCPVPLVPIMSPHPGCYSCSPFNARSSVTCHILCASRTLRNSVIKKYFWITFHLTFHTIL